MPDPSPQLVDTIARAIADADEYDGYWTELCDAIGNQQPGTGLTPLEACRAMYRREARAALAAMPKPIGYVGAWHEDNGWTLDIEYGEYLRPTAAQALKDCSDYHCPIATVVAVVPVEAPDE